MLLRERAEAMIKSLAALIADSLIYQQVWNKSRIEQVRDRYSVYQNNKRRQRMLASISDWVKRKIKEKIWECFSHSVIQGR